ncbi:HEAT repeat domain-containing protein [Streptomyces sp. MS1.HAVA.3]|uniref:HEAT repeat domain-containing protein n=1 Tax=Streptomyces caledonius TaxID=3134107 RepID=A0ABU8UDG4_9ACTN
MPSSAGRTAPLRRAAVTAISLWSSDVPAAARHVLPLLGDPDAEVRQAAVQAFSSWGTVVVPLLQTVRLDGPGPARAGALEALAEIGGEVVIAQGTGKLALTEYGRRPGTPPGALGR